MHAYDRTVDHLHPAIVSFHDRVHKPVPDAGFAPAVEAIVDRRVRPVALGQIAPWQARAQHKEHAVEDLPVVLRLHAAPFRRQHRFDNAPLEVRQIVTCHDQSSDVWERESLFASRV